MTSRLVKSLGILVLVSTFGMSSCLPGFPGGPTQPQPTGEATSQPTTQPGGGPTTGKPAPTRAGSLAAGTVLLDQATDLSATQGGKIEMNFNAPAMQPVSIETTLASGTPSYELNLVDKYGNFLVTYKSDPSLSSEKIAEVTLPYASAYKLVYTPLDGDGSITAHVAALGAATGGGSIEPGSTAEGLIGAPLTYHTYQFTLQQGQSVTLGTRTDPGGLDTSLVMYGPDGNYLTDADDINPPTNLDAQVSGFITPMTGTYTAIVTSKDQKTGSYTFSVVVDTELSPAQGPADILYDKDYRANFSDKSNLDVTLDGSIGDVLKIEASGVDPALGLDLYLSSPFGQILGFAVNPGKGKNTDINEIQLPYSGRFKLELRPVGDGQATFRVSHLTQPPSGGGILSDSQPKLPGVVSQSNVFHMYQFDAKAGDKVSLAAFSVSKGGALDLGFALIGPNGRQLLFADDSQSQFPKDPELTDYEIMQGGTYLVVVYSFTSGTGTYDLVFTRK